jgi:plasmid replication initiation protein
MSKSEQKNKKELVLAQANVLTQAKYNFSVIEKRAVYFIIKEVRRQFVDRTDGQRNLFDNLLVRMNTEELTKADMRLSEVYQALVSLRKKTLWLEDRERVLGVGYINYFEHKKREPFLEVEVSRMILPYLVELAEKYTAYSLTVAMSLKTKYTQRFYEYCSQYENSDKDPAHKHTGYFFSTPGDLRAKLMLEDKYPRYALLKKKVLDIAQQELKSLYDAGQCNLYFDYSEEKYGRSVHMLHFFIYSKNSEKTVVNINALSNQAYYIRSWLDMWFNTKNKPKNKLWVTNVISHITLNADLIPKLYNRLEKLQREKPNENHAALARHIIEEDFLA